MCLHPPPSPPPQAMQLSQVDGTEEEKYHALQKLMRKLQLEDEDIALAIAIANSLMEDARRESERAELEQVCV